MIHAIRAHHERSTNRQSDANGTHKRHAHSKRGLRIVSSARVAEACAKIPLEKVKDEAHKVESSRSKARCKRGAKGVRSAKRRITRAPTFDYRANADG